MGKGGGKKKWVIRKNWEGGKQWDSPVRASAKASSNEREKVSTFFPGAICFSNLCNTNHSSIINEILSVLLQLQHPTSFLRKGHKVGEEHSTVRSLFWKEGKKMPSPQTGITGCSSLAGGTRGRWRERSDGANVMSRLQGRHSFACLALAQRWEATRSFVHGWLVFGVHCMGLHVSSSLTECLYCRRFFSLFWGRDRCCHDQPYHRAGFFSLL